MYVVLNGEAIKSCLMLAVQAEGSNIMTVEGLGEADNLHPIQEGFWENTACNAVFAPPE